MKEYSGAIGLNNDFEKANSEIVWPNNNRVVAVKTKYMGPFSKPTTGISYDTDHMEVLLVKEDGSEEVIFSGEKYNEKTWKEQDGKKQWQK